MRLTPRESRLMRIAQLCESRGVSVDDIIGRSRLTRVSKVRKEVYTMLRDERVSFPVIAQMFGRDHTTVVDGVQRHRREQHDRDKAEGGKQAS